MPSMSNVSVGGFITASNENTEIGWINAMAAVQVIPTSATGTGVALSADGTITTTNSPAFSVNGCFTSTYSNYLVIHDTSAVSAALGSSMRMRLAGTDDSSTQYWYQNLYSQGATTTSASAGSLQTSWSMMPVVGSEHSAQWWFTAPALARATRVRVVSDIWANSSSAILHNGALRHNVSTAFDGFTYTAVGGNVTSVTQIYGWNI